MHKRSIQFTEKQYEWLVNEAKRLGVTFAEFLRRIVDERRDGDD